MKKLTYLALFLLYSISVKSQVSYPFNFPLLPGQDYVGWNLSTNLQLDIKNEAPKAINFYTDAGAGGFGNLRMFIEGTGNVGVGNFSPANTLFHIHQADRN